MYECTVIFFWLFQEIDLNNTSEYENTVNQTDYLYTCTDDQVKSFIMKIGQ